MSDKVSTQYVHQFSQVTSCFSSSMQRVIRQAPHFKGTLAKQLTTGSKMDKNWKLTFSSDSCKHHEECGCVITLVGISEQTQGLCFKGSPIPLSQQYRLAALFINKECSATLLEKVNIHSPKRYVSDFSVFKQVFNRCVLERTFWTTVRQFIAGGIQLETGECCFYMKIKNRLQPFTYDESTEIQVDVQEVVAAWSRSGSDAPKCWLLLQQVDGRLLMMVSGKNTGQHSAVKAVILDQVMPRFQPSSEVLPIVNSLTEVIKLYELLGNFTPAWQKKVRHFLKTTSFTHQKPYLEPQNPCQGMGLLNNGILSPIQEPQMVIDEMSLLTKVFPEERVRDYSRVMGLVRDMVKGSSEFSGAIGHIVLVDTWDLWKLMPFEAMQEIANVSVSVEYQELKKEVTQQVLTMNHSVSERPYLTCKELSICHQLNTDQIEAQIMEIACYLYSLQMRAY